jgi:hypothetical protein
LPKNLTSIKDQTALEAVALGVVIAMTATALARVFDPSTILGWAPVFAAAALASARRPWRAPRLVAVRTCLHAGSATR